MRREHLREGERKERSKTMRGRGEEREEGEKDKENIGERKQMRQGER